MSRAVPFRGADDEGTMTLRDRIPFVGSGGDEDPPPFLARASTWATELQYHDIPKPVRRAAKSQLTSTVGAAVWTLSHPLGSRIADAVLTRRLDGNATFLGGSRLTPEESACGNAALSVALDFDETLLGGHTGHSSVFVPLAYAEALDASGREVVLAQVAANEIADRLAAAAGVGSVRSQEAVYVHAAAAAVGRCLIEGDDAETLSNALAVALGQPPWPLEPSFLGSDAKPWGVRDSVRTGLDAVDTARANTTGNVDVVEAEQGFLDEVAERPVVDFLDGLGKRWHTRAVSVKDVPGSVHVVAPVEAALEARGSLDRGRTTIRRIDVYASRFTVEANSRASPFLDGPASPISTLTSTIPYNVAVALVDGAHTPNQLEESRVDDPAVWRLADRVFVHHDPSFTLRELRAEGVATSGLGRSGSSAMIHATKSAGISAVARHPKAVVGLARRRPIPDETSTIRHRTGVRVEVTTTDGRTIEATVEQPTGFAGTPLAEVRAVARRKCRRGLRARGVREPTAREITEALLSIDGSDAVSLARLSGRDNNT